MNPERFTQDNYKMVKVNNKLKGRNRRQPITQKGDPIRLSDDFFSRNFTGQREWQDIFKVLKEKILQNSILHPAGLFRIEGKMKSLPDNQNLKEFITTKFGLTRNLKGSSIRRNKRP